MPLFHAIDFTAFANYNTPVRIALKDDFHQWLVPPFTKGYFAIAPLAIPPAVQTSVAPIFERDTSGLNVRFTNLIELPDTSSPEWFLDADILPADTAGLAPGVYYYEARLDFNAGKFLLKEGKFRLMPTIL